MHKLTEHLQAQAGNANLDHGIGAVQVVASANSIAVYTTSGSYGGMTGYRVNGQGDLVQVDEVLYNPNATAGLATDIALVETAAGLRMYLGGVRAEQVLSYAVGTDGQIGSVQTLGGLHDVDGVIGAIAQGGDGSLLLGNPWDEGFGRYDQVQNILLETDIVEDRWNSHGHGLDEIVTVTVDGTHFAITAAKGWTNTGWQMEETGLTTYELGSSHVIARDAISMADGTGIMVPTDMATVVLDGQTYILLTSAQDNAGALSVLSLDATGALGLIDHVGDTRDTRFAAAQAVAALEVEGRVYVVVGGGDDGLSLFTLMPGGQLVLLDTIADSLTTGLDGITQIEMAALDDMLHVFVATQTDAGLTQITVDLSNVGLTQATSASGGTTSGSGQGDILTGQAGNDSLLGQGGDDVLYDGAGQDTLRGGAGADLFVFSADDTDDRIADFDLSEDRIDLSGWAFFKDADALELVRFGNGVQIRWQDERLDVVSSDPSGPMDLDALRAAVIKAPTRLFEPPAVTASGSGAPDLIEGDWGADTLSGGGGNDTLRGGDGDDRLEGGSGNDVIDGEEGFDTALTGLEQRDVTDLRNLGGGRVEITSASGVDTYIGIESFVFGDGTLDLQQVLSLENGLTLQGSNGADLLQGGSGDDTIDGGLGNDTINGGGGTDVAIMGVRIEDAIGTSLSNGSLRVTSAEGVDIYSNVERFQFTDGIQTLAQVLANEQGRQITGSNNADTLYGGGGDDTVTARSGDDWIEAGLGNDWVDGGSGEDTVRIAASSTTLFYTLLQSGWVMVASADGTDRFLDVEYLAFDDATLSVTAMISAITPGTTLTGGQGRDSLTGTLGDDRLMGEGNGDTLDGSWGDDTLKGGQGNDVVMGGVGDDQAEGGDGHDQITGAQGHDTLKGKAGDDTLEGGDGDDRIRGGGDTDLLLGGAGHDVLGGQDGNDDLRGSQGDDLLLGNSGQDSLTGGSGIDTLKGGQGLDTLNGGDGDDRLLGNSGNDTLQGGAGDDMLKGGTGHDDLSGGNGNDDMRGREDNDRLEGGDGADTLRGDGGNDTLFGDAEGDLLRGGSGDDRLLGGIGADTLKGGGDDDTLFGGTGNDDLEGENGHDRLEGEAGGDTLRGGAGDDTLDGGDGADRLVADGGADLLVGQAGNDTLLGGAGNDLLRGGDGRDALEGGSGADTLRGDDGDDTLEGGDGNDLLEGGSSDDHLTGGTGRDTLEGGGGADTFIFAPAQGNDLITDFNTAQDVLRLDDALTGGASNGQQVINAFAQVVGSRVVLDFGGGQTLTLEDVSTLSGLADTVELF